MSKFLRTIVHNYIENSNCSNIIAKDGITTDQFAIKRSDSLFVEISINMRQVQQHIPAITRSVSIAKNLDYYQKKICCEIPSISDTAKIKLILQKLRVIIIAMLMRLNKLVLDIVSELMPIHDHHFQEWNKYSEEVLILASAVLVDHQQGKSQNKNLDTIKEILGYLGVSISEIDYEISCIY